MEIHAVLTGMLRPVTYGTSATAALITVLLCCLALRTTAQDGVFLTAPDATTYPQVMLDMRAVSGGGAAWPLDPSRVVLRENGRMLAVTLDCTPLVNRRPSLALGFERSLDANFPVEQDAARQFVARMGYAEDGAEASFWSFATFINRDVSMTGDSARLARAVEDLTAAQWPFNGTALYESMHRAIEDVNEFGSGDTKAVVFFTDGYNNTSTYSRTWEQVRGRAVVDNIRVYVILVYNRDAGRDAMRSLTAATGGFMVEHDVPGAVDSVYNDIVRPDSAAAWCTLRYVSPFCANGQGRRIEAGYVRRPGDTLWSAVSYTAPWNPDDLRALHAWVSPERAWDGSDTITVAVGVEVRDGMQPPAFTLALPLEGCTLEDSTPLRWGTTITTDGASALLAVQPPASGLTNGQYTLARLRLGGCRGRVAPFTLQLRDDASGCLHLAQERYTATADAALDTILAERGTTARMPLRVSPADMPEGVQRVNLRIRTDDGLLSFDAVEPVDTGDIPPGWGIRTWRIVPGAGAEVLELLAEGPPLDTPAVLGHIVLAVRNAPVYRIPLKLESPAILNGTEDGDRAPGLVIIRDSCFNNLVTQSGLVVSRPWPQPARGSVSLRVFGMNEGLLQVSIRDALGRLARRIPDVSLGTGAQTLTLDLAGLQSGRYVVICSHGTVTRTLPLVVVR